MTIKKNTRKEHFKHVISSKTFNDGYKGLVCASSVLSRQRLTNTWVTYFLLCIHSTTSPARVCEGLHHAVQRGGLLTLGGFRDSQRFLLTFFTWASLIFSSATRIFSAFALAACSSCGWHNDMLTKKHLQSITPSNYANSFICHWGMKPDMWTHILTYLPSPTCSHHIHVWPFKTIPIQLQSLCI